MVTCIHHVTPYQIDEWKEKPWLSISPRKVRSGLDTLLNQCKAMPARLRSYSSYDYVTKVLKNYIKVRFVYFMDNNCRIFVVRKEM